MSVSQGEAELQSGGRVSVYERSGLHFLELKEVRAEDAGSYTCSISNSAGMATASAELTVQGETANHRRPSQKCPAGATYRLQTQQQAFINMKLLQNKRNL